MEVEIREFHVPFVATHFDWPYKIFDPTWAFSALPAGVNTFTSIQIPLDHDQKTGSKGNRKLICAPFYI